MIIINNNPSVIAATSAPGAKLFSASDKFKLLGLVSEIQRKLLLENSGLERHRKKEPREHDPRNSTGPNPVCSLQFFFFFFSVCVCVCERERERERKRERESRGDPDARKSEGRKRTGQQRIRWLDGITNSMDI